MAPKTVALIGAACLSGGWLVASLLTPPVARLQTLPVRRGETPRAATAPVEPTPILQLDWRATHEPPVPRRNPFVFGARRMLGSGAEAGMATTAGESADAQPLPLPPRVTAPPYTLAGVGVTGGVRTAVLSDGATVHLVTVGQTVGGYAVVAVADDSVTLADAAGERFVIRLR